MVLDREQLAAVLRSPLAVIERLLLLEDGRTYEETWEPWQRADFEAIFATLPDGRPKHRLCYIERRRGEDKTQGMAAVGVADLICGPRSHCSYARGRPGSGPAAARQHRGLLRQVAVGGEGHRDHEVRRQEPRHRQRVAGAGR